MATTSSFSADALYPGGQGLCGIVFTDPGIAETLTVRKFDLTWANVQPFIWNMKTSVATLNIDVSCSSGASTPTSFCTLESTNFVFTDAELKEFSVSPPEVYSYAISATDGSPKNKVCGDVLTRYYAEETDNLGITTVTSDTPGNDATHWLLPQLGFNFLNDDGSSPSYYFIKLGDGTGTGATGSFTLECYGNVGTGLHYAAANIHVDKIWIKNDGSCSVYCTINLNFDDSGTIGETGNLDPGGWNYIGDAVFNFLGATSNIPIYALATGVTLNHYYATYAITVSEAWTY